MNLKKTNVSDLDWIKGEIIEKISEDFTTKVKFIKVEENVESLENEFFFIFKSKKNLEEEEKSIKFTTIN